jgi:hypothetical protein
MVLSRGNWRLLKFEEYGMFRLQDPEELRIVFTIIVALNLKLQSLGPIA